MPASQVIDMATVNGAKALGFTDTGTIAPGKKADIVLINLNRPHLCPVNDVKSSVVYSVQAGDVDTVIVDGNVLVQNNRLTHMDEERIMAEVKQISKRIRCEST